MFYIKAMNGEDWFKYLKEFPCISDAKIKKVLLFLLHLKLKNG
jgi:hypothetical protein